ncbi:hypothetical protein [Youxingia wuxianensis]|uniref:Uncharacterized protein n=1 Tax=Youxingia wuxianensis TaxID=2763678 RepID=A0A926EUL6_9FIRM|nr:hypothetical protein [Youxingia wuxianensis]MBC8586540.1 hypothetical protein [Youxingia wuxianensis]
MDDLSSTISQILNDPAKMEQLKQVAQAMGITPPDASGQAPSPPPVNNGPAPAAGNGTGPDIASILSALSGAANGNGGGASMGQNSAGNNSNNSSSSGGFNLGMLAKIQEILSSFNSDDKNTQLLRALKPHISENRAGRIDDAVRIMQLIRAWPAVKDSGLLNNILGNILGGGGSK